MLIAFWEKIDILKKNNVPIRGHRHITSPPWGEGGLQNDDI